MRIKQTLVMLIGALLVGVAPMAADAPKNYITNPGFEDMSCNFLGCELKGGWNTQLGSVTENTTDKYEGERSAEITIPASGVDGYLNQQVSLTDNDFAVGATFELTIHYRVKKIASGGNLSLDCFWGAAAGGDSEAAAAHEKDILTQTVETTVNSEWQEFKIKTTKPKKTSYLSVGIKFTKGSTILFDDFSLVEVESTDPYISVTPENLPAWSVNIGEEVSKKLKIRQGHLTSETTFAITGANPDQFSLSATSMAADQSEMDLVVTYKPKAVGNHTAALIFDNVNHTTILPNSIKLSGACSDPTKKPEITVNPTSITDFKAIVGESQKKSITVSSLNCTDYVYVKLEDVKGSAFTSSSSMISPNYTTNVDIWFQPKEEGEYESNVTFSTQGGDPVTVVLKGKAEERSEENIDWLVDFKWDLSSPLAILNETFENVNHNKTLILDGWQNVAKMDQRPWWGYDGNLVPQQDTDSKCAKATAYQNAKESTGMWEMWLITPALDFKNAGSKIFTFSVMGQYLPEEGSTTTLEIYYIDANIDAKKDTVFFQDLTESFDIPATSDENLKWRTFQLDLAPYAENIADIFHMGFHFKGPNGNEGAVTYYVDNVSWGRTDLPVLSVTPSYIIDSASIVGKERWIGEFTVSGMNLVDDIELSLAGSNYNRFKLSKSKLPKEGGKVQVAFTGAEAGIHEAYVQIDSQDAASKFVVLAVRCYAADDPDKPDVPDPVTPEEGIEGVQSTEYRVQKILRDGQVIIVRDGKEYSILGVRLF